ncbi:glycosyltransferase, partial [Desulfococcus sp.]|uniref:glycosyltransferase n=1 Tax=Desulfococcus sp. TaxID=2025834 RepID=UPI0035940A13
MIRSQAAPEAPAAGWGPYAAAALLSILLCLAGGRLGDIGAASLDFPGWTLPAGRAILLFAAMWAAGLAMLLLFPRGLTRRRRLLAILVPALLCRLFLLPLAPSDDLNRYLWEGRVVQKGVNPYLHPPDDPALSALARQDPLHGGINHPDIPAVYPPLMLLGFSGLARLGATPMAVKSVMTLFDLGTLVLVIRLLSHRGLDERWAALHAFNPVVLYAFAGQGHLDAVQNFFLLSAICLYDQKRWGWMFAAAGLAVQTKYAAVLTLPFLVNRENLGRLWAVLPAAGLPFLPFLGETPGRMFTALAAFGTQFAFNGSVHGLLRWTLGGIAPATAACQAMAAAAMIFGYLRLHPRRAPRCFDDPVSGCFFALGAVLLFSPTVHFWYVAWIVPFLALRPTASWMVLCLTIGFGFTADGMFHLTGRWHLPAWAGPASWLPFWALFARDIRLFFLRRNTPLDPSPPASVSVVIPARNEGPGVAACVSAVLRDRRVAEAIVVDGGSADDTAVQAE